MSGVRSEAEWVRHMTDRQTVELSPREVVTFRERMALAEKLATDGELIRLRLRIAELEDEIARLKSAK